MTSHTAVGVDNNLSSGQPGIAMRAADDKSSGRIDQDFCVTIDQFIRDYFPDDKLFHIFSDDIERNILAVLCGNHDRLYPDRTPFTIFNGDLGF